MLEPSKSIDPSYKKGSTSKEGLGLMVWDSNLDPSGPIVILAVQRELEQRNHAN